LCEGGATLSHHVDRTGDRPGARQDRAFYADDEVGRGFIASPIDIPFEVEDHVTAVSGWQTWEL
jgi:hypothetical protein